MRSEAVCSQATHTGQRRAGSVLSLTPWRAAGSWSFPGHLSPAGEASGRQASTWWENPGHSAGLVWQEALRIESDLALLGKAVQGYHWLFICSSRARMWGREDEVRNWVGYRQVGLGEVL